MSQSTYGQCWCSQITKSLLMNSTCEIQSHLLSVSWHQAPNQLCTVSLNDLQVCASSAAALIICPSGCCILGKYEKIK